MERGVQELVRHVHHCKSLKLDIIGAQGLEYRLALGRSPETDGGMNDSVSPRSYPLLEKLSLRAQSLFRADMPRLRHLKAQYIEIPYQPLQGLWTPSLIRVAGVAANKILEHLSASPNLESPELVPRHAGEEDVNPSLPLVHLPSSLRSISLVASGFNQCSITFIHILNHITSPPRHVFTFDMVPKVREVEDRLRLVGALEPYVAACYCEWSAEAVVVGRSDRLPPTNTRKQNW
ncbi:hypothetical protein FRB95_004780 [Tulasnella sp. JGI-2019a]|nr:hypothetical protein FRB95_004780 [Tulasnella sp. JGI-2019a]